MFSKAEVLLYIACLFLQESIQQSTSGPTIIPKANFDLKGETIEFERVLGLPCGEIPPVIDYLTSISNDQRQQVMDVGWKQYGDHKGRHDTAFNAVTNCFSSKYNKDKTEWGTSLTASYNNMNDICTTPGNFLAYRLQDSLQKGGKDLAYQSIMCTSTGEELSQIDKNFPTNNYKSLTEAIDKELDDKDMKTFFKDLLTPPYRSNAKADDKKTADLVKSIPTGDNAKCTADATSKQFYDMMHKESFEQIKAVGEMWNKNNNNGDIVAAIANRCASHLGSCFKRIFFFAMSPAKYFAAEASEWFTGKGDPIMSAGTRIVISRSEIDLADIIAEYDSSNTPKFSSAMEDKLNKKDNPVNVYLINKLITGNKKH